MPRCAVQAGDAVYGGAAAVAVAEVRSQSRQSPRVLGLVLQLDPPRVSAAAWLFLLFIRCAVLCPAGEAAT